jgi:hypothetical protein
MRGLEVTAIFRSRDFDGNVGGGVMALPDERTHVVEAWLRLPESRRRHATDAVAFAYRLLREQPEIFCSQAASHENIVTWLQPFLTNHEAS